MKTRRNKHPMTPIAHWRIVRKWVQGLSLIAFILTLLFTRLSGVSPILSDLPIRLSPYAMLLQMLGSRIFLTGSLLSLVLLISSLVVGRAWCGWLCPLGTMLDVFSFRKSKNPTINPPESWRRIKYFLLFTAVVAALFGNLSLLIFDPLTISVRTFTGFVFPAIDHFLYWLESVLIQVPFLSGMVSKFDQILRPAIFQSTPAYYQFTFVFLLTFLLLVGLNLVAERFWCRYLCPLGALLGLGAKISLVKRQVSENCSQCALCESQCPTGTIQPAREYASDPSECTLCLDCFSSCKNSKLVLDFPHLPIPNQEYDPNRRTILAALGVGILGSTALLADSLRISRQPFLLRPPGADPTSFTSDCVRCGLCVKSCPTQAIQFDLQYGGAEGAFVPVFIPRIGFCDYACNSCGQVCPVQAIPPLDLKSKRETVIGKAYINQNRCLAWSDHTPCIVCEEMCPIPDKAIKLTSARFTSADGSTNEILLPIVERERCIGCGTCEYKCPVAGEAAIRVYSA